MRRFITLNRDDYHFFTGLGYTTEILIKKPLEYIWEQMDAENIIPYWIYTREEGYWGYADNDGIEFEVIFV